MERLILSICCLGMALMWLPAAATAGERVRAKPSAAQPHAHPTATQAWTITVGVTLVQAAGHEPLSALNDHDEHGPRWRRTASGWERSELWKRPSPGKPAPMFDPILFAALQWMLSLMALIAWPDG